MTYADHPDYQQELEAVSDADDWEFVGCDEDCPEDCMADHAGEL